MCYVQTDLQTNNLICNSEIIFKFVKRKNVRAVLIVMTVMTSDKKLNVLCTKQFTDNQFNFFQIIPDPHLFNIFFPLDPRPVAKPRLLEKFPG